VRTCRTRASNADHGGAHLELGFIVSILHQAIHIRHPKHRCEQRLGIGASEGAARVCWAVLGCSHRVAH
jgi:hypothetical protein